MKRLALCLSLLALPASLHAASPSARPEGVFGELVTAPLAAEQPRWAEVVARHGGKSPPPPLPELSNWLARVVGAPAMDGVDLKRPMALVLVDPRRGPLPALWVFEVQDEKRFAESLKAAPSLASRRLKRAAVVGNPDAVGVAGDYALSRLRGAPQEGVRGRLFVQPVWAAYGAQAALIKAVVAGQAQSGQSPMSAATMNKFFDGFFAGIEQTDELGIELVAKTGVVEGTVSASARPGTAFDTFVGAQRPSDFSLLSRLAAEPGGSLFAGHVEIANAVDLMADWMFGEGAEDGKSRAQAREWMRLCSGDIAMLGTLTVPSKAVYQYLLRGADAKRLHAILPVMMELMSKAKNGVLSGMATVARTALPPFTYDGLAISQVELKLDFTKMGAAAAPAMGGETKFTQRSAWTGWDDVLAMATGAGAEERIKKVVDAARGKGATYQPSAAIQRGIERARANKESFWMRMDVSGMSQMIGKPMELGFVPTVGLGFATHRAWVRFSTAERTAATEQQLIPFQF